MKSSTAPWQPHAHSERRAPRCTHAFAALVILFGVALCGTLRVEAARGSVRPDELPPTILKHDPVHTGEGVRLYAEVVDPSGPGTVTLYVMGPGEPDYVAIPMQRASGSSFEALVSRPDSAEPWIAYYFEATDALGNGPTGNGSQASPFVERFQGAGDSGSTLARRGTAALFAAPVVALLVLVLIRRRGDQVPDRAFWIEVLAPVSNLRGQDLDAALERLGQETHYHPVRGKIRIHPTTAKDKLERLAKEHRTQLEEARLRQLARPPSIAADAQCTGSPSDIDDALFWLHVLGPLLELTGPTLESELRALSGRSLAHPRLGRHYFDVPALRSQLVATRHVDAEALLARAAAARAPVAAPNPLSIGNEHGTSLIELLVVVALLALALGVTVFSLLPVTGPVERAGEQVDGLMRQARARAMAGATVHRVRPLDEDSLVVESARDCSSGAWSLEERLRLDFDSGVRLADTGWSVCFDGQGLASENFSMTLLHAQQPPVQLEMLRGGMVRWIS